MTKRMISGSNPAATTPSLSDIVLSIANVKGAVAAALETVEHNDDQAAGALILATEEMGRIQEQLEGIQRSAREVTQAEEPAKPSAPPTDDRAKPLSERIEEHREEMFGAMAMIAVARDSVSTDHDYNMHRILDDAYGRLDKAALSIWDLVGVGKCGSDAEVTRG